MSEGPEFAAAEWMSGWIALSFLDDPLLAKDHFEKFFDNVSYPISLARGPIGLEELIKKLVIKNYQTNGLRNHQHI